MVRAMGTAGLLWAAMGWAQAGAPGAVSDGPAESEAVTTLKLASRVVAISAVVTSKGGEPRGGLTKDDFVLKQDGREEPIRYFSQGSDLPLTLALLVDTSGSQQTFISDETEASDVFFETMLERKEDRAMLVEFDTSVQVLRGLTDSPAALHLSLLSLRRRAATQAGTLLNDAVYTVSQSVLAGQSGRKAMVILTDGGDLGSRRSVAEAVEQAQRGDVQIYSILFSAAEAAPVRAGAAVPADPGRATLEKLSESTGGRVFTVSRAFGLRAIYAEIARELRLQYELGYTPPPGMPANSYHKLELRARDKRLVVQARKGFFAQP